MRNEREKRKKRKVKENAVWEKSQRGKKAYFLKESHKGSSTYSTSPT